MMNFAGLPKGLRGGAQRWIDAGIQPGSFLSAVIANDLHEACGCADDSNLPLLPEIVKWFYNEVPSMCWGSHEHAQAWAKRFGREWHDRV